MGRGLDGFYYLHWPCAVFKVHRGRLAKFRWRIASGRHLFPFRTEQLSHSAPMVLGGQPPGRVGRRRFFVDSGPPQSGGPLSFSGLAARRSSPNGLEPVLAERGEVDQQVDGVGQPSGEGCLRVEHRFVSYEGSRTERSRCNGACISCLSGLIWRRMRGPAGRSRPASRRSESGRHRQSAASGRRDRQRGTRPAPPADPWRSAPRPP
jgi:hypothetical protein